MSKPTHRKPIRNTDGSFKTVQELAKQSMTVLQYGRFLASLGVK